MAIKTRSAQKEDVKENRNASLLAETSFLEKFNENVRHSIFFLRELQVFFEARYFLVFKNKIC